MFTLTPFDFSVAAFSSLRANMLMLAALVLLNNAFTTAPPNGPVAPVTKIFMVYFLNF